MFSRKSERSVRSMLWAEWQSAQTGSGFVGVGDLGAVDAGGEQLVDAAMALRAGLGDVGAVHAGARVARRAVRGARCGNRRNWRSPSGRPAAGPCRGCSRGNAPRCGPACRCSERRPSARPGGTWRTAWERCAKTWAKSNRACPACRAGCGSPGREARRDCPARPACRACSRDTGHHLLMADGAIHLAP